MKLLRYLAALLFASAVARAQLTPVNGLPPQNGFAGDYLTTNGSVASWGPVSGSGMANPMTTLGDTIIGGTAGAPTRLGIGATNSVYQVIAGSPGWSSGILNLNGKTIVIGGGGFTLTTAGNAITFTLPAVTDTIPGIGSTETITGNWTFNGSFTTGNDATIHGVPFGIGVGGVNTNVVIGVGISSLTTAATNVIIGYQAAGSMSNGNSNVVVGYQAFAATGGGAGTVAIGWSAVKNNSPNYNTGVGYEVLNASNALYNTAIGFEAALAPTTGGNDTFLGALADATAFATATNSTAVGYNAQITASNQMVFGNGSITSNIFTGYIQASSYVGSGGQSFGASAATPPSGGFAWGLGGARTSTALVVSTTTGIQVTVAGTEYTLAVLTSNP
jgi:hypothetical protein